MEEEFIKNIKGLYRDKSEHLAKLAYIVIFLLITLIILNLFIFIRLNKKIDYRYFNITNTLEEIYNVKINTYDGSIKNYR